MTIHILFPFQAVFIERANSTLESMLYKKMTSLQTGKWIDILDDVVESLNARPRDILHGLSATEAHKKENEENLRSKFLADYKKYKKQFERQKAKFKIGDHVRLARKRTTFHRGYEVQTEPEVYIIENIFYTYPITYSVEGKQQKYYAQQLVKATPASEQQKHYYIANTRQVNQKRLRSGRESTGEKEYLLRSSNDPELSTYISETQYQKLKDDGLI